MSLAQNGSTDDPEIDPKRLLMFREVARRGSLSAAAAALGWTQPAVGQHVQKLERDLGLSLVIRSTRGIALTDAGDALLAHADAVASRLAAARDEMTALRTLRSGRLRLAAFPSACAQFVPRVMSAIADEAPDIDIWLTEVEPPEARASVLAGDVDVAVLFEYRGSAGSDAHPDLVRHDLFDDPVLAVLAAEHPLVGPARGTAAVPRSVDLASLGGERWVAGCVRCRTQLESLAGDAGFRPDIRHTTDDYVVVQALVAAGLAVALLPALALAANANDHVVAVPLAEPAVRRVTLIHRREAASSPAVRVAVRAFTTAVRAA